jgi:hypothetical protein
MSDSHNRLLAIVLAVVCLLAMVAPAASAAPRWLGGIEVTEATAFLLDSTPPTAKLVKPAGDDYKGATFVTGQDFLLVGTAEDQSGIKDAWFELCPEGTSACLKDWNSAPGDDNWRAIKDVPADKTPDIDRQYQTEWDSTEVLDGYYFIRICAEDNAGNTNCADSRVDLPLIDEGDDEYLNPYVDAHWVYVNNRFKIPLQEGWNLISTPLALYESDIEDVLADLIAHGTVEGVWTMVYEGVPPKQVWRHWTPTAGPVDTLTKIVDGQAYWIKMKTNDSLTIVGTWTTLGDGPPWLERECPAADTWHLIGYTHRGRPTILPADTVGEYIMGPLEGCWWLRLGSLFYYDPWNNVWKKLYEPQNMIMGRGYWLYVTELPPPPPRP